MSLVAMCAWFVASNHCAMGLMPKGSTCPMHARNACHGGDQAPSKNRGNNDGFLCCKSVKIADFTPAKNIVNFDRQMFAVQAFFAGVFLPPDLSLTGPNTLEIDTGPPRGVSFAEAVLQRSILAHAPPVLA